MRRWFFRPACGAAVAVSLSAGAASPAAAQTRPIVTIDPPCPVLPVGKADPPVQVRIAYDPGAPGARLAGARAISMNVAFPATERAEWGRPSGRTWKGPQGVSLRPLLVAGAGSSNVADS
jgi:hypothetical protein